MTKINTNKDVNQLPLANDMECKIRRELLIRGGIIKPANKNELIKKKEGYVLSTKKYAMSCRKKMINQGIINQNITYKPVFSRKNYIPSDEGQYNPKPIKSDREYNRRKNNYLWMISDILKTRENLRLILGKKSDDAPDWYF